MRALDLYCCAGGASMGLYYAGFNVTGIDINSQKNYPFNFIQMDITKLNYTYLQNYDFIWASPPCQHYSNTAKLNKRIYPDLIAITRELLDRSGKPFVIENVESAPLVNPIMLCGTMFNLRTYRHRLFESNFPIKQPEHGPHLHQQAKMGRQVKDNEFMHIVGHFTNVGLAKEIMGCYWMNREELAQAIPPVYAEYIAKEFLNARTI